MKKISKKKSSYINFIEKFNYKLFIVVFYCFIWLLFIDYVKCEPSLRQEQDLLILEALSKRPPGGSTALESNYETNSIMVMLERSKNFTGVYRFFIKNLNLIKLFIHFFIYFIIKIVFFLLF